MAKRINIQMSPIMREVGTKVINPTPTFDPEEYEKALLNIAKKAEIKTICFDDIDDDLDLAPSVFSIPNETQTETPFKNETGFAIETPFKNETGTAIETSFKEETSFESETGIVIETPSSIETGSKKKGPTFINIDLNSIEREKVSLDCIRLEAVIEMLFKDKKLRIDGWIKLSRETLKAYRINGARLNETRLICKGRGTIDFKIENEGKIGKEKILYKPLK
jgi:hypothetical protein